VEASQETHTHVGFRSFVPFFSLLGVTSKPPGHVTRIVVLMNMKTAMTAATHYVSVEHLSRTCRRLCCRI